jgi:histidyl-tRNA synthetase
LLLAGSSATIQIPTAALKLKGEIIQSAIIMKFQPPRGTRDFLPEDMIRRQYVLQTIWKIFEKWGFDPLETPAFEDWALLSAKQGGGEEIKNEIYYFKDKSDRELGLRFDFTIPLARVIANNPGIAKPFRRYQIGPVWRYDRPGSGRYREFYQADIDIVGAPAGESDALCIAVACDAFKELGFDDFFVRLNNRKIIEAFLLTIGIKKEKITDALRSIDKLEKIGEKNVADELKMKKIDTPMIKKILEFTKIKKLSEAKKYVEKEKLGQEGVKEMETILNACEAFGISDFVKFDLSLVRGLEYYTGPVFEVFAGLNVSAGGGGRYDNLIQIAGGNPTPATGISLGIDRILLALEEKKLIKTAKTNVKIYIASINEGVKPDVISLARKFFSLGISVEFDLMNRSLSKQLAYVNAKGIPFSIVIGDKEVKESKAKLRDMKSGKESEIHFGNLEEVKKYIK